MDTGNVRLIPASEEVNQEKKIETIYQAPNSQLLVKISNEIGDDVKTSAHELDSDEREGVEVLEGALAGPVEGYEDKEADVGAGKNVKAKYRQLAGVLANPTPTSSFSTLSHTPPPSPPIPLFKSFRDPVVLIPFSAKERKRVGTYYVRP